MASRLMRSIARLVGAEYRVGRCDELHLAPASALGHGRPRAPFVSRLPRVPVRGRLPGRSLSSFPSAPRLDVGVYRRPRHQELPSEPVQVDLFRSDEVVRPVSACPPCTPASRLPSSIRLDPGCPRVRRIRLCVPWFLQSSRAAPCGHAARHSVPFRLSDD